LLADGAVVHAVVEFQVAVELDRDLDDVDGEGVHVDALGGRAVLGLR
jgi:hypothetical protein